MIGFSGNFGQQAGGAVREDLTSKVGNGFQKGIAILFFILLWEFMPRFKIVDPFILTPFTDVIRALVRLTASGEILRHLLSSFQRSFGGFVLAMFVGIPVGVLMGWFKRFERMVDPLLQVFRNTSILALFPVFILVFGLGEVSKIAIIFWGTLWPTLLNTIGGVKNVDPILVKSARSMGISQAGLLFKVVLPAASPSILTGIRLSAASAILVLVAAEMLGANSGLGFLIFYAEQSYAVPDMYAGILSLSVIGCTVNYVLVEVERRVTRWKEEVHAG
ncbi:MAG: ABC transporter permease [Geobacter sp.]|nr:ABC transporter permease [Geobacter sp.]